MGIRRRHEDEEWRESVTKLVSERKRYDYCLSRRWREAWLRSKNGRVEIRN